MKVKISLSLAPVFLSQLLAGCVAPQPGTPVWGIAANALTISCAVSSEVDKLNSVIQDGFAGTFTYLDTLSDQACIVESLAEHVYSSIDVLVDHCGFPIYNKDLPLTITVPGRYFFAEDLDYAPVGANTIAISISVSNVIIDLNNKTLRLTTTPGGTTGIRNNVNGLSNLRIMNGTIDRFENRALLLNVVNNSVVSCVKVYRSSSRGFFFSGLTGSVIKNCVASNNGTDGFYIQFSNNNIFKNCFAEKNSGGGFYGVIVNRIIYKDCIAEENINVGFLFDNPNIGCILESCIADGNRTNGIRIQGCSSTIIKDCVTNNTTSGSVNALGGIGLATFNTASCVDNIVINNTSNANDRAGIALLDIAAECKNNYVAFNSCIQNGTNIDEPAGTGPNTYLGNFALNSTAVGDPNNTNYSIAGMSNITSKVATIAQGGSISLPWPTFWTNINMLP